MKLLSHKQLVDAGPELMEALKHGITAAGGFISVISHDPGKPMTGVSFNMMFEHNGEPLIVCLPMERDGVKQLIRQLQDSLPHIPAKPGFRP